MQETTESDLLGAIQRLNAVQTGREAVEQLNGFLCSIHRLISQDSELSKVLQFRIQGKKGGWAGNKPYLSKALAYVGPDEATADLLTKSRAGWEQNPTTFYAVATSPMSVDLLDPQAQIVGSCLHLDESNAHARMVRRCHCIVLEKFRQRRGCRTALEIALSLHGAKLSPTRTLDALTEFAQTLIDAGSRYVCIEEELGVGSIFLLGQDVPDMVWEKRLPKSGEVRKEVIDRLKQQQVPGKAREYKTLRILVVDHALAYYGVGRAGISPTWGADIISQIDFPSDASTLNELASASSLSMTEWLTFDSS